MSSEYTISFKEAMVEKMSGPSGVSACSLSVETGAPQSTLSRWREEMLQAPGRKPNRKDPKNQRIKELESELRRKEKALAETAALLTLRKKARDIWGDSEDDG